MASDYTLSRHIQSTKHLDYGNGIWASPQTLGCRDNFVKPHIHTAIAVCTAFETPLLFPAPNFLATITFVAEESPTKY